MKKVLVLTIIFMTVFAMLSVYTPQVRATYTTGLISRDPISIIGNSAFTQENGVIGGSGTVKDPYIIEGWDINASKGDGIYIENTDAYFIIRNVWVHDGTMTEPRYVHDGIVLRGVKNGRIEKTRTTNNHYGVFLHFSSECNVVDNVVKGNSKYGIFLHFSSGNNIVDNTVIGNSHWGGIGLLNADDNNIMKNNASLNYPYGIFVYTSVRNDIKGNIALSNAEAGISLWVYADYNVIVSNIISKQGTGISIYFDANHNTIMGNNISENGRGIFIRQSSGNVIYNNYLNNSGNVYDEGSNIWNTTKTLKTNIVGGPYLGGNYYSDYVGEDLNGDGLGDSPHAIPGGSNIDYLPLIVRPVAAWTFMVYLDADNNLEGYGIKDFDEMEIVGSTDQVNIVIQMDRHAGYDSSNGDWTTTRRYYVTKDDDVNVIHSTMIEDLGEQNMGDHDTLIDFVE